MTDAVSHRLIVNILLLASSVSVVNKLLFQSVLYSNFVSAFSLTRHLNTTAPR